MSPPSFATILSYDTHQIVSLDVATMEKFLACLRAFPYNSEAHEMARVLIERRNLERERAQLLSCLKFRWIILILMEILIGWYFLYLYAL